MNIISSDLLLAIPIAAAAIMLISSSIINFQAYFFQYSKASYIQIKYYSISQQMLEVLYSQNISQTEFISELKNLSNFYNISAELQPISNLSVCVNYFCRMVTAGGAEKIMVIK